MKAVIVYLNENERLKRAIDSLKLHSPQVKIDTIKVENPSEKTDPLDELNKYFQSDRFTEDVIVWHPDMYATSGWYENLLKHYDAFDVLGCKMIYPNGILNHYGGCISFNGIGVHPHQGCLNIGLTNPLESAYVTGPGTVIKKKVIEKMGHPVFDKQFFKGYYGDVDFCFRARELGFTVGVLPVDIIHEEGVDSVKKRPKWKTQELQALHNKIFQAKWMNVLQRYK